MARPPRFSAAALGDLLDQTRYASADTRRRQMAAAERLLREIDPGRAYPVEFIIFRITGYRMEIADARLLVGESLFGDLATYVERLSYATPMSAREFGSRVPLEIGEVRRRLGISATTLHRYRRRGLVVHQVTSGSGRRRRVRRLVVMEDALAWFEAHRMEGGGGGDSAVATGEVGSTKSTVKKRRRPGVVDDVTRARMIRRARRYRERLGWTLNRAAGRLAARFGRSVEGVRQILRKHDGESEGSAVFRDRGPLRKRERAVIVRAFRRGIPVSLIARRFDRTRNTIHRVVNGGRLAALANLDLAHVALPTFLLPDAETVLLSPECVREGFDPEVRVGGELRAWMGRSSATEPPAAEEAIALLAAMNYLLNRAAAERDRLGAAAVAPRATDLDAIETRLRWADRLRWRIAAGHQRLALTTLEIHLGGRTLAARSAAEIRFLHDLAERSLLTAIASFDASRGQEFEGFAEFSLRRELARRPVATTAAVAGARHSPGTLVLPDLIAEAQVMASRRGFLELHPRLKAARSAITGEGFTVISAHHGWNGRAPMTYVEIGEELGIGPERSAGLEHEAIRSLMAAARKGA